MAKGNMLLGYARGSVGDVTFSRVNGQQVQKARNRNPNNPRTDAQMWQRAKLAGLVNFFKHCTSDLINIAYEDKKSNESYYNAFVRHNMPLAMPVPQRYNSAGYMPIAPFVLSQGSIPAPTYEVGGSGDWIEYISIPVEIQRAEIGNTVKIVSAYFKRAWGLKDGDFLTAVSIYEREYSSVSSLTPVITDDDTAPYVIQAEQIKLSSTDGEIVPSIFSLGDMGEGEEPMLTPIKPDGYWYAGVTFIVSRKTPSGWQLCNSVVHWGEGLESIYQNYIDNPASVREVINRSWGASGISILEGSASIN